MEKQQKEFLIKWAKVCKIRKDYKIHCAVTTWDYGTIDEYTEIVAWNNKITVRGDEQKIWLDFFSELISINVIVRFNFATDGSWPIKRVDADYRFASQSIINEYSILKD